MMATKTTIFSYAEQCVLLWDSYLNIYDDVPIMFMPNYKIHWKGGPVSESGSMTMGTLHFKFTNIPNTAVLPTAIMMHIYHENIVDELCGLTGCELTELPHAFVEMFFRFIILHEWSHYIRLHRMIKPMFMDPKDDPTPWVTCYKNSTDYIDNVYATPRDEMETDTEALQILKDIYAYGGIDTHGGFETLKIKSGGRFDRWVAKRHKNYDIERLGLEYIEIYRNPVIVDPSSDDNEAKRLFDRMHKIEKIMKSYAKEHPYKLKFIDTYPAVPKRKQEGEKQ